MAKLPPGALLEGKERMLSLHIAPNRKTAENLELWQGQWTGLCDLYASHCYELPLTREQFAALPDKRRKAVKDVGGVIPARLREGRRLKEAVLSRDFISLDIDNAPLDFIDRYRQFINRAAIIHSTASSTPDLPRYRVLIPLLETLRGDKRQNIAQKYEAAARQAIEALDLTIDLDTDKVSITCCQLMYWPACCKGERPVLEFIGGNFLDAARDLPLMVEAARRRKASSQPGIPQTPAPSLQAQAEDEGARLDAALADLFGGGTLGNEDTAPPPEDVLGDFEALGGEPVPAHRREAVQTSEDSPPPPPPTIAPPLVSREVQLNALGVLRPESFMRACDSMPPEAMKKNILSGLDQWKIDAGSTETLFLKACFVIGLLTDDKEFYPEVEKRFAQRTGAILYSNMGRQVTCPDKGTSD